MNKQVYKIKKKINSPNQKNIPVIQPDHVSLGKCATCQQFKRRYSSVKDIEVINILRDGCRYLGFKKIVVESMEEEGFANMHHVIRISNDDNTVVKEVCIQRQTELGLKKGLIKETSGILTDINSVLIINYNIDHYFEFFFFSRHIFKKFKMEFMDENIFVVLRDNKLYLVCNGYIKIINFSRDNVTTKVIELNSHKTIAALSSEMFLYTVTQHKKTVLHYDNLQESQEPMQVSTAEPSFFDTSEAFPDMQIFSYRGNIIWIVLQNEKFSLYHLNKSNELLLIKVINLADIFGEASTFSYENCYYNRSTKQILLMYCAQQTSETTRYILIFDMRVLSFSCILEMELTLKRLPSFQLCPSRDGCKLFVQETFENKVMFYQVFTLIPSELMLENIASMYVRKNLSDEHIKNANIPRYLKEDLLGGTH